MKTIPMGIAGSIEELGKFAEGLNKTLEAIKIASFPEDDEEMQKIIIQAVIDSSKPLLPHLDYPLSGIEGFKISELKGERGIVLTKKYGANVHDVMLWVLKRNGDIELWHLKREWKNKAKSGEEIIPRQLLEYCEHYTSRDRILAGTEYVSPLVYLLRLNLNKPSKIIDMISSILRTEIEKREKRLSDLKSFKEKLEKIDGILGEDGKGGE